MLYREIRNLLLIVTGSLLLSLGVALFLAPNRIATGGTPGAAILLHFVIDLPIGTLMAAINLPLLLAGGRLLGRAFVLRTVVAILLSSLLTDLFANVLRLGAASSDSLLAALYGGIGVGLGVGLILRGQASAGGSTIVARIVAERSRFRAGQVIFAIDLGVILATALVFRRLEPALWSLISIYVTARCIDAVLGGRPRERAIETSPEETPAVVGRDPHRHVLAGDGGR